MSKRFENPSPATIRGLLERTRTIAVVGLSPSPYRPSHRVAEALQGYGYRIIPINPQVTTVLGEPAYPELSEIPETVDLVEVFRAPAHVAGIVDECIARGVPALWLQDGVIDAAEALRARAAGIEVVMDRCLYRDYVQLRGGGGQGTD